MEAQLLREVVHGILKRWEESCVHAQSVPVVLLCQGIDQATGHLVVCADADLSLEAIRGFMAEASFSVNGRVLRVDVVGEGQGDTNAN